ncbi:MAG: 16S rRNA pseudouridylate synthase [Gammaproteobacteria bacterium (ex Lamellibrachia satsuma)]|nr:MAG: 16S rRNA pseudouridine(516) synthase RsuA [Gammaproteobacteria bacterium (ex Lamellibrachia satsuma)]RRS33975.1 MAG: 16S rRNA pseudouridylate synthase [Gammaproteobacteria bacterium (ex Lamellibrachia satsuma)]RRS35589.1 MAG: 16S rRNA pseudouridylate synthase [Gammaproteobacteria bacterium (ex Lamellibrachia satsuma)]
MRLDKYLSSVTRLSRSQAQKAIRAGRVMVDGETEKNMSRSVVPETQVILDGNETGQPGPRYFMLHKPQGYVCSTGDPQHPTVLELLDEVITGDLHFAGRLDIDATGLVLITSDGQWSHRIVAPGRKCRKRYRVTLAEPLTASDAEKLRQGVLLRNEPQPTQPAMLEILAERICLLTITEGRYHQVKRMFAAVGNRVIGLHRVSIGNLELDENLAPGAYRCLSLQEIEVVTR